MHESFAGSHAYEMKMISLHYKYATTKTERTHRHATHKQPPLDAKGKEDDIDSKVLVGNFHGRRRTFDRRSSISFTCVFIFFCVFAIRPERRARTNIYLHAHMYAHIV